ncbi:hypothetical protein VSS37_10155 [Candidatus Thiothrix sp. Deng01]|uniref:Uncharacterized protein n=1 Tax=Candidatus Thiothrix phosphatis TaxID=3112415 RepID=A0ABU6CWX5_9GAMM|nr:hypothetical protein [Candidatus Thiothrix sp. Deng01]MEB4591341.1 hypothetical protein [Candidatus Thiothrix sp. Deng01]
MGMTYWLNVRDGDVIESEERDLSYTCKATDTLDRLCVELGVLAVSEFVDGTEMGLEYEDEPDFTDADEALYAEGKRPYPLDEMRWCDAKTGLETFRSLQAQLDENPESFELDADDLEMLAEELDEILEQLEQAEMQGQTFHLELLA